MSTGIDALALRVFLVAFFPCSWVLSWHKNKDGSCGTPFDNAVLCVGFDEERLLLWFFCQSMVYFARIFQ